MNADFLKPTIRLLLSLCQVKILRRDNQSLQSRQGKHGSMIQQDFFLFRIANLYAYQHLFYTEPN